MTDLRDKLQGCFRLAGIAHSLIVHPDKRVVIARGHMDGAEARIVSERTPTLEPSGLALAVADLFAPA